MKIIKYKENIYIHSQIIINFETVQNLKNLTYILFWGGQFINFELEKM